MTTQWTFRRARVCAALFTASGPDDYADSDRTWCRAAALWGVHGVGGIWHRANAEVRDAVRSLDVFTAASVLVAASLMAMRGHDEGTSEPIRLEHRCA